MCMKIVHALLTYFLVYVIAFEDLFYVYGQVSQEVVEQGRMQYQNLQALSTLPKYGSCWKSAVEQVEEGCRALSEETQSDMALHITNCFLEMSGLDTYNCELNKKPNLKRSCISHMSDKAFNVYTEFYTHIQNICWFLRGQVWHETIAENTLRVGKQLESSAKNQEEILRSQRESLELQGKLLDYGKNLEKIMEDFYVSTRQHQEILSVMSQSLRTLQSWLVGEISWLDLVVFYVATAVLIGIFTSSFRTAGARLPIVVLLIINAVVERLIQAAMVASMSENEIHLIHNDIHAYVWWSRKIFMALAVGILLYTAFSFRDLNRLNNLLLQKIYHQNISISETLAELKRNDRHNLSNGSFSFVDENNSTKRSLDDLIKGNLNGIYKVNNYLEKKEETYEKMVHTGATVRKDINVLRNELNMNKTSLATPKDNVPFSRLISGRQRLTPFAEVQNNGRYNLRSRQGTPDANA